MIAVAGRAIRRACSAGAGRLGAGPGRFAPGRVGNARAAYRAAAENLLALLEAVISAVHDQLDSASKTAAFHAARASPAAGQRSAHRPWQWTKVPERA